MKLETIQSHAIDVYSLFCELSEARNTGKYDVGDHNICCAVVCLPGQEDGEVFYSYSNCSAIKSPKYKGIFITDVPDANKLIHMSPMQDKHTEYQLINYLYANGFLNTSGTTVHLFTTRPVCNNCRKALYEAMQVLNGTIGITAYDFDGQDGTPKFYIRPISKDMATPRILHI